MEVRWANEVREDYLKLLESITEEWGSKAAEKLIKAVDKIEENLSTGIAEYAMSKQFGIYKCRILEKNILLYEKYQDHYYIVGFIYARSDHPY